MDSRYWARALLSRRNRRAVVATTSAIIVALGGCSGSDQATPDATPRADVSSGGSSSSVDACSLLTASQIGAATGLTWGSGTLNASLSLAGRSVCDWYAEGGAYAAVQVMVVPDASAFDANRASAAEVFGLAPGGVVIDGADDAYATEEGSLIAMRIGGRFIQVSYVPPGPGNVLSATRQLAQTVAAGL